MHSKRSTPTPADPGYYDEDCVMVDMIHKGGQKTQQERFVIEVSRWAHSTSPCTKQDDKAIRWEHTREDEDKLLCHTCLKIGKYPIRGAKQKWGALTTSTSLSPRTLRVIGWILNSKLVGLIQSECTSFVMGYGRVNDQFVIGIAVKDMYILLQWWCSTYSWNACIILPHCYRHIFLPICGRHNS
jgi:hypothetical protein